jgi:hypothetical protein
VPDADGGWQGAMRLDADSADGTKWPFGFGYAIAATGDRAVVGMPTRDFGEGRVWRWHARQCAAATRGGRQACSRGASTGSAAALAAGRALRGRH